GDRPAAGRDDGHRPPPGRTVPVRPAALTTALTTAPPGGTPTTAPPDGPGSRDPAGWLRRSRLRSWVPASVTRLGGPGSRAPAGWLRLPRRGRRVPARRRGRPG